MKPEDLRRQLGPAILAHLRELRDRRQITPRQAAILSQLEHQKNRPSGDVLAGRFLDRVARIEAGIASDIDTQSVKGLRWLFRQKGVTEDDDIAASLRHM